MSRIPIARQKERAVKILGRASSQVGKALSCVDDPSLQKELRQVQGDLDSLLNRWRALETPEDGLGAEASANAL